MYTKCWLEYHRVGEEENKKKNVKVFFYESNPVIENALKEIQIGFRGLFDRECVLIREESLNLSKKEAGIYLCINKDIGKQGYHLKAKEGICIIEGGDVRGILYGVFELLRKLQMEEGLKKFEQWSFETAHIPQNPLRMLNHWDNMDGSIERGYSGRSFFFENDSIIIDERTKEYARLAASVGINAVVINNVNVKYAATELITKRYFKPLRRMSELFASYGIDLYLSVNYAAPVELKLLDTADPCEKQVAEWWREKAKEIWENIPHLGGFLIKADSEGRPGPFTYGRTHADGANMLADAVAPYSGNIIWRCFVYNCTQDWRDTLTDRAKAGYDNFRPLDGQFRENVVLQIKNGPMDFQVREPISPLFGGLKSTNMMLEVQIAQEYTGQQRHVCYLLPWFKQILEFDMHCEGGRSRIADLIRGQTYEQTICGIAAVANTGNNDNWTGHDLAASNLYGFGRLAFDMSLSEEEIAREWIRLTFGSETQVMEHLLKILMMSWPAYEKYTSPLGIGWMVNPNHHYGPNVDGYEYDRWGTYHRADCRGIGVDRTIKGTNFCGQYHSQIAATYGSMDTCPDELLLFFHHVPYTHRLKSGKTVIQHIYDTHFEGAEEAELFLKLFEELKPYLEEEVYKRCLERLKHQAEHSLEWRDIINAYFYRKSGIRDEKGRKIYAEEI